MKPKKETYRYAASLMDANLDPLIIFNNHGGIIAINNALSTVTGITREEITRTDFFSYFTEPAMARNAYQELVDKGHTADCPLTIRHNDGTLTNVLFNGSVYKDVDGNTEGAIIVARNIAAPKWAVELRAANKELLFQNEEKEKRAAKLAVANMELALQNDEKEQRAADLVIVNRDLVHQNSAHEIRAGENAYSEESVYSERLAARYARSLIEASLDPLVTISTIGKITDMNEALTKITGISRARLSGTDFANYFTEPEEARKIYQEVFAKGFVANYPLTIRDHTLTNVLFNGSVYKDEKGNVIGAVVVARDITDQKRIEKELIEARVFAEMATGLAEDAKNKAEMATHLAEDAVRAKQQFLSNMSHEIRTPMNAIIGFTKVVLKTQLTEKQKEYLTAIKISGDSLIVLINDILDLAKVDAGKMIFEKVPFKMAVSISAMLHLFETKIQEKNLELIKTYDPEIPEVLIGDPVRLHQIILNLVSNAVKFTSKGTITVDVKLLKKDPHMVTVGFSVTDTGIGIKKENTGTIFENFQQASSGTSRLYGGTGLGLAIVKQLVEAQHGSINVLSTLGKGSTFSFSLSFEKTAAKVETEGEALSFDTEMKNVKVLIVEDMPLNQLLMKTVLDDFGFERDIAANGKIAIEKLQEKSYDIILMDLQMPEMNGFEATEYIRKNLNSKIPIIALTADVTTVDVAKCRAVGMNDYVAKPIDERLLYSKIIGLVKKLKDAPIAVADQKKQKCTDLRYLIRRTKSDPDMMMEMISLYLEQIPPLIIIIKQSMHDKDWHSLYAAIHKIIPSFSIMGMGPDFENIAKKVQEYAKSQEETEVIPHLVSQLENVCLQACEELLEEYNVLKKSK